MQYSIPNYYKEFECLADRCEDTCCAGWQIVVDRKSLRRYQQEMGNYRKELHKGVDFRNGTFRQDEHKRCAFLNKQNLCNMYLNLGEGSLCRTCRMYPRHVEEFENVREITLSVSCPEVARILLTKKEPVFFLTREREGDEEYEDFDPFLYSQLVEGREVIRKVLQDRDKSIVLRAMLALGIAHDMQVRIQKREVFSCDEVWKKYQSPKALQYVTDKLHENKPDASKRYGWSKRLFTELYRLELLCKDWNYHLQETYLLLYGNGKVGYEKLHDEFGIWLSGSGTEWEIPFEQLLVYFVDTYFCGGVYDGNVYNKMNMSVVIVFLLYEMLMARWLKNGKTLESEDMVTIVYRFSREIEHSDINIEKMEKFPKILTFFDEKTVLKK